MYKQASGRWGTSDIRNLMALARSATAFFHVGTDDLQVEGFETPEAFGVWMQELCKAGENMRAQAAFSAGGKWSKLQAFAQTASHRLHEPSAWELPQRRDQAHCAESSAPIMSDDDGISSLALVSRSLPESPRNSRPYWGLMKTIGFPY